MQKEIVEWVLVEVLKILFIRMLLRKFQNVSISDKSILNMAFPLHNQTQSKTGFHPANSKFNFKIKNWHLLQNHNQELANIF